jgi:hypothetical protein
VGVVVELEVAAGRTVTAANGEAHSPQNFASAAFAVPHAGHGAASGLAHSLQNLRPASFAVPQFEQTMHPSVEEWRQA